MSSVKYCVYWINCHRCLTVSHLAILFDYMLTELRNSMKICGQTKLLSPNIKAKLMSESVDNIHDSPPLRIHQVSQSWNNRHSLEFLISANDRIFPQAIRDRLPSHTLLTHLSRLLFCYISSQTIHCQVIAPWNKWLKWFHWVICKPKVDLRYWKLVFLEESIINLWCQ